MMMAPQRPEDVLEAEEVEARDISALLCRRESSGAPAAEEELGAVEVSLGVTERAEAGALG